MMITLRPSSRKDKKWQVLLENGKIVHFGQAGASDFTMHKDPARRDRYIARHKAREKWGKDGIDTAGFWSRWLLWNKPSLQESIRDIENRFAVSIDLQD